ncbi:MULTISPECIES: DMT family transporter [Rhodobacterales]|jgi:drug/metabolite transporter (DMT)-like permease|uniref:DMT family transporter n=1 Tax=Rhodobacterales TaxID=204455 RepID=UPI00237FBE25|nr:DMT family transporter [Phaeobacter gallaeciensis]MDE4139291.1 DMT family transporter [Phaeobacter gallaeciensis]MDE4147651.1 DMT family transporter [Phaeobacter gallaeciensis]MDE4151870.1 DMT family transporter [Phaeobacter gallaeciensis]MDE4227346.1 DMT family transporter [Phaeobacter gallaeciensis]MDE4256334.1 DMT family transporter [Phaeobacter gallaeciensis]
MTTQHSISPRAWVELSLLACLWGASFLSIRITLNEVPVLTSVFYRCAGGAVVLWVAVLLLRLPLPRAPQVWGSFLVMGLLNNVIPFVLMAWGQLHIETGLTSILNATTAIFGVLVAALFFSDERITARRAIGVALGFLGVSTAIGLSSFADFDPRSAAQLAVLTGTLSYAFAAVWAKQHLAGLKPQVAAAGMLTGSALILLPLTLVVDGVPRLDLMPVTWLAIFYYAVFATAGAYLLYYRVLAMAGSGNLMLVTLMIPPVAILLGAVVLGEALPPHAYPGFALLALGLLIIQGRIPLPRRLRRN